MKEKMPNGLKIGKQTKRAIKQIRTYKKHFGSYSIPIYPYETCECCGYPVEGYGDICKRCGWEQAGVEYKTGANPVSVETYKKLFLKYGN